MINKVKDLGDLKERLVADVLDLGDKIATKNAYIEELRKDHKATNIRVEVAKEMVQRYDAQRDKDIEILSVITGLEIEQVEDYIIACEKGEK